MVGVFSLEYGASLCRSVLAHAGGVFLVSASAYMCLNQSNISIRTANLSSECGLGRKIGLYHHDPVESEAVTSSDNSWSVDLRLKNFRDPALGFTSIMHVCKMNSCVQTFESTA